MSLLGFLLSPITSLIGSIIKTPKPPVMLPAPTRDDARQQMRDEDALRRRQGAAADIVTGTSGAEAGSGSVGRLVVGS